MDDAQGRTTRELAVELADLLAAFIDALVLEGFVITKEQWGRACYLCGRWSPPFVTKGSSNEQHNS